MTTPSIEQQILDLTSQFRNFTERQRRVTETVEHLRNGPPTAATPSTKKPVGKGTNRVFDEFVASVTAPAPRVEMSPAELPPPSRFRVRVATVGQPHRTTKRNYNYFDQLNSALEELETGGDARPEDR